MKHNEKQFLRNWLYQIGFKLDYNELPQLEKEAFDQQEQLFFKKTDHIPFKIFNTICFMFGNYWENQTHIKSEYEVLNYAYEVLGGVQIE